jgi:hypothetical protein
VDRVDYPHKHRHGVNVQAVTDPTGHVLWISPAAPARAPDPGPPPGADAHPTGSSPAP